VRSRGAGGSGQQHDKSEKKNGTKLRRPAGGGRPGELGPGHVRMKLGFGGHRGFAGTRGEVRTKMRQAGADGRRVTRHAARQTNRTHAARQPLHTKLGLHCTANQRHSKPARGGLRSPKPILTGLARPGRRQGCDIYPWWCCCLATALAMAWLTAAKAVDCCGPL
jgi:hypothetical protein